MISIGLVVDLFFDGSDAWLVEKDVTCRGVC